MPVSPDEVSALACALRERTRPAQGSAVRRSTNLIVAILATALLAAIVAFAILRVLPSGPAHKFTGEVLVLGYGRRSALIATVRLTSGRIAHVRVPYSAKLTVGSPIMVREQPVHIGPPRYYFSGTPRTKP
jgi:hypothetical protein